MIDQGISQIFEQSYNLWQPFALELVNVFQQGLAKINFELKNPEGTLKGEPDELKKIRELLEKLKKEQNNQETFTRIIKDLASTIDSIAKKNDYHNIQVNNFFMQFRYAFNTLAGLEYSQYKKYVEAVRNPSGRTNEVEQELSFISQYLLNTVAKFTAGNLLSNFEHDVLIFARQEVANLDKTTISQTAELTPAEQSTNLLKSQFDDDYKYQQLQSKIPLDSDANVKLYLNEQSYGAAFEFYYIHVAELYDQLQKVNLLSAKNSQNAEQLQNTKQQLLASAGLTGLGTPEAVSYLNEIANVLGFNNAAELHKNYTELKTSQGYLTLKNNKEQFCQDANNPQISKEQDNLQKLKAINQVEYQRVHALENKGGPQNATYYTCTRNAGKVMIGNLDMIQMKADIVDKASKDYLNGDYLKLFSNFGEESAFYLKWPMRAIRWFTKPSLKHYLDMIILGNVQADTNISQRNFLDKTTAINAAWEKEVAEQINKEDDHIAQKLGQFNRHSDEEKIENLIVKMQNDKILLQEVNSLANQTESTEYNLRKATHLETHKDYKIYKTAFHADINNTLYKMSPQNLNDYINLQHASIKTLHDEMQSLQQEFNNISSQISSLTQQTSSRSWLTTFASFFGITTNAAQMRAEQAKQILALQNKAQELQHTIEHHGLKIGVINKILRKADGIQQKYSTLQKESLEVVSEQVLTLAKKFKTTYHDTTELSVSSLASLEEMDTRPIIDKKNQQQEIANELRLTITCFSHLLNEHQATHYQGISLDTCSKMTNGLNKQLTNLRNFDATYCGLNESQRNLLEQDYLKIITELGKISAYKMQAEQAAELKKTQDLVLIHLQNHSLVALKAPFTLLSKAVFNNPHLSSESRKHLLAYIFNEYTQKFTQESNSLNRREFEELLLAMRLELQFYASNPARSSEEQMLLNYYQNLAATLSNKLDTLYPQLTSLSAELLKYEVDSLGTDFIYYLEKTLVGIQKAEEQRKINDSWLLNPFGSQTAKDMLKLAEDEMAAYQAHSQQFTEHFLSVLQAHQLKLPTLIAEMTPDEITAYLAKVNQQRTLIKQLSNRLPHSHKKHYEVIIKEYEEMATFLKKHDQSHLTSEIDILEKECNELKQEVTDLGHKVAIINQALINDGTIDEVDYLIIIELLANIKAQQNSLERRILEVDSQLPLPKLQSAPQWLNTKQLLTNKMSLLNSTIVELEKNQGKLAFHHSIHPTSPKEAPRNIDAKSLGKGLLLAIKHGNQHLIEDILKRPLEISELAIALKLAAINGDDALITKILANRQDISFTSADINLSIEAAIENNNLSSACKLLLATNVTLTSESREQLFALIKNNPSSLATVEQGYLQLAFDNDYEKLNFIRNCFVVNEVLINSLQEEYKLLLAEAKYQFKKDAGAQQQLDNKIMGFYNKLQLADQLREKLLATQVNARVENTTRKEQYLGRWAQQIKDFNKNFEALKQYHSQHTIQLSTINKNQSQLEQAINNFAQTETVQLYLQDFLRSHQSSNQPYLHILSHLINLAASKNNEEALNILLSSIDNPIKKQEFAVNALKEALNNGQTNVVRYLLLTQNYAGHQEVILDQLATIHKERNLGFNEKQHQQFTQIAYQVINYLPAAFNETLQNTINQIAHDIKNEDETKKLDDPSRIKMAPITTGWMQMLADHDFNYLDNIRNAYILQEHALKEVSTLLDDQLFALSSLDPDEFDVNAFEHCVEIVKQLEIHLEKQQHLLATLTEQCIVNNGPNIDNQQRLQIQLARWNKELEASKIAELASIKKKVSRFNAEKQKYTTAILAEQSASSIEKRMAPLTSQYKKMAENTETSTSAVSKMKSKFRPSPS